MSCVSSRLRFQTSGFERHLPRCLFLPAAVTTEEKSGPEVMWPMVGDHGEDWLLSHASMLRRSGNPREERAQAQHTELGTAPWGKAAQTAPLPNIYDQLVSVMYMAVQRLSGPHPLF